MAEGEQLFLIGSNHHQSHCDHKQQFGTIHPEATSDTGGRRLSGEGGGTLKETDCGGKITFPRSLVSPRGYLAPVFTRCRLEYLTLVLLLLEFFLKVLVLILWKTSKHQQPLDSNT